MLLKSLCPPALIYLIFSLSQIIIDAAKGYFNTALVKVGTSFIFTILLNYLCNTSLGIISWIIVFVPFILMSIISVLLLGALGLHPKTGTTSEQPVQKQQQPLIQNGNDNNKIHSHLHSHSHSHNHNDTSDSKKKVEDRIKQMNYGVDNTSNSKKLEKQNYEKDEIDYDKKTIQGSIKDSNSDYKWYKRLYENGDKFGKRHEYVKIVRNI